MRRKEVERREAFCGRTEKNDCLSPCLVFCGAIGDNKVRAVTETGSNIFSANVFTISFSSVIAPFFLLCFSLILVCTCPSLLLILLSFTLFFYRTFLQHHTMFHFLSLMLYNLVWKIDPHYNLTSWQIKHKTLRYLAKTPSTDRSSTQRNLKEKWRLRNYYVCCMLNFFSIRRTQVNDFQKLLNYICQTWK